MQLLVLLQRSVLLRFPFSLSVVSVMLIMLTQATGYEPSHPV